MGYQPQLPKVTKSAVNHGRKLLDYTATANRPSPPGPTNSELFGEKMEAEATSKYGVDIFRRHETPPAKILEKYDFQNKESFVQRVWGEAREKLGFHGDCREEWEKAADMPLAELTRKRFDFDTKRWPANNADADESKSRLKMVMPAGITAEAVKLSARNLHEVRVWGKEIDQLRVDTLKQTHGDNIRATETESLKIKIILQDFENLLRAKRPTGLRGIFFYMSTKRPLSASEALEVDLGRAKPDYRGMSPSEKMMRGEIILQQLDAAYRAQIEKQEERTVFAENSEDLAADYKDILVGYARALKKNRTRLLVGEDTPEKGSPRVQSAVDTRLDELDRSEGACEREILHYQACAALYEELRARMSEVVDVTIEAYRTQMRSAYLSAVGQQVFMTDSVGKSLDAVIRDKTRAAKLSDDLENLADKVRGLAGLQQALENNEKLVLEYKQPIALEYHKVLALPAPHMVEGPVIIGEPN